jgi:rhodanese-related sulfurtransferase
MKFNMKKIKLISVALGIAIIFKMAFASNLDSISPADAYKLQQDKKAIIVDVREADEVKAGKVKDALVIPMSIMNQSPIEFDKAVSTLPVDKQIILYCHSGRRAGIVGEELLKRKFKVVNMKAFDAWKSAGLPTE